MLSIYLPSYNKIIIDAINKIITFHRQYSIFIKIYTSQPLKHNKLIKITPLTLKSLIIAILKPQKNCII